MSKKPDVSPGEKAVVEELNLLPREAGQTTESAYKSSLEASPTFKMDSKSKKRATPRRPKKKRPKKKR